MLKIFLVDDSGPVRRRLSALIGALAGVVIVGESEEADTALGCIRMTRADLVIVDPHLAGGNGMGIVESLARATPPCPDHGVDQSFRTGVSCCVPACRRPLFLRQDLRIRTGSRHHRAMANAHRPEPHPCEPA
jgi:hypothetical protein